MNLQELRQTLRQSVSCPDASQIRVHEEKLLAFKKQHPSDFTLFLTELICKGGEENIIRQASSIILKVHLSKRIPPSEQEGKEQFFWDFLNPQHKDYVKAKLIEQLYKTEDYYVVPMLRNTIPMVLGSIAAVEVPRGEWVKWILQLASHQNKPHSIIADDTKILGSMCYYCSTLNRFIEDTKACEIILDCFLRGGNQKSHVQVNGAAVKALCQSIDFFKNLLGISKQKRDQVFKFLFGKSQIELYKYDCIQGLSAFCENLYPFLDSYIQKLLELVISNIPKNKQEYEEENFDHRRIISGIAKGYIKFQIQQQQQPNLVIPNYLLEHQNIFFPKICKEICSQTLSDLESGGSYLSDYLSDIPGIMGTMVVIGDQITIQLIFENSIDLISKISELASLYQDFEQGSSSVNFEEIFVGIITVIIGDAFSLFQGHLVQNQAAPQIVPYDYLTKFGQFLIVLVETITSQVQGNKKALIQTWLRNLIIQQLQKNYENQNAEFVIKCIQQSMSSSSASQSEIN